MKTKLERFALSLLLAPLAPIALLLVGWWLADGFLPETWIPFGVCAGLAIGLLADAFLLPRLLEQVDRLGLAFWLAALVFYAVGTFGLFMGVPVFNALLAIPAGFVVGGRLAHRHAGQAVVRNTTLRTSLLTTALLAMACLASATFALASSSTPGDLQGMFGLPFEVTRSMLWALILVGGAALLLVNWILTSLSVRLTYRWLAGRLPEGAPLN